MDIQRSCFKQWMWWDAAQTLGSWVMWYFVDDNPFFPQPHIFSSETWDEVHWWNPGAGWADDKPRYYRKGAGPVPFPTAQRFCGNPDWYLTGAPANALPLTRLPNGRPVCCTAPGSYSRDYSLDFDVLRY